jgi:hypothetical protein
MGQINLINLINIDFFIKGQNSAGTILLQPNFKKEVFGIVKE